MHEVHFSGQETDPLLSPKFWRGSLCILVRGPLFPVGHWDFLFEGSCPPCFQLLHPQSGSHYSCCHPPADEQTWNSCAAGNRLQVNPDAAGMSWVNINRLLTFIFFSLCKIPIINSDLRDQTVNNVLILAYFQVMYCIISESYGGLILSLTNTSKSTREGLTSIPGKEAINSSARGFRAPLRHSSVFY